MTVVHGVAERSYTAGDGPLIVSGALADTYTFADRVADGATKLVIEVKGGALVEYFRATFTAPDILTPTAMISSSLAGDRKIAWPVSGQRIVRLAVDLDALVPLGGRRGRYLGKVTELDLDIDWLDPPWFQQFSVGTRLLELPFDGWDGNREIFNVPMPVDVTFPAGFGGSPLPSCKIAPLTDVVLTLQAFHFGVATTVATLTILAGDTRGTLDLAAELVVPAADNLRLYAPRLVDDVISGLSGVIVGAR